MTSEERIVQHYLQTAHDRGGGWEMAMRMMALELEYNREGRRGPHSDLRTWPKPPIGGKDATGDWA